jgi:hypothetical protein
VWRVFFIKLDYAGLDWLFIIIFRLLLVKCFHQIVMIALKICLRALPVLLPRELRNLRVFVLFLSKNENNNGFDLIGLSFFPFDYRRVVYYLLRCGL